MSTSWCEGGFEQFLLDMGLPPDKNFSLDRIDFDSGYSKENCRWTTKRIQTLNRRSTVWVDYNGHKVCLKDYARLIGCNTSALYMRINKYHWSIERTLTTPVRKRREHGIKNAA